MTTADKTFLQLVTPYIEQLHRNGEPYVWTLKLSRDNYEDIENALDASINSHQDGLHYLLSDEFAPCVIVYIAEWYKRCYESPQSRSKLNDFGSNEWKSIWEHCGFDNWEKYVYHCYKCGCSWESKSFPDEVLTEKEISEIGSGLSRLKKD
jgi:hypothetical protein